MHLLSRQVLRKLLFTVWLIQSSSALKAQDSGLIEFVPSPKWNPATATTGAPSASPFAVLPSLGQSAAALVTHASTSSTQERLPNRLPALSNPSDPTQGLGTPSDEKDPKAATDSVGGVSKDDMSTRNATASKENEKSLAPLQNRALTIAVQVVDLSVADLGTRTVPDSAASQRTVESSYQRNAAFKCVHWHPSSICHFPLRFEDAMLERHGQVRYGCWQPLVSGVKFFGTIPLIPYLNTLHPRCEPVYALGNYRPGGCAPVLRDSVPWDRNAAVVEALSLAGYFWAAPL